MQGESEFTITDSEALSYAASDGAQESVDQHTRYRKALALGRSPIIVDRGNGLNAESREYALLAEQHGYHIELREPDSPWWQELRVLLKYSDFVDETLFDQWAEQLSAKSATGHRVPAATIRRWIKGPARNALDL